METAKEPRVIGVKREMVQKLADQYQQLHKLTAQQAEEIQVSTLSFVIREYAFNYLDFFLEL